MITTKCSKCGAIEHTKASIDARCMFCDIGIMREVDKIITLDKMLGLFFLLILVGCVPLQDTNTNPKNYSPESATPVQAANTSTNITPEPEPPKEILLPVNGFAVYILDVERKGSMVIALNGKYILLNANPDTIRTLKIIKNIGVINLDYLILTNSNDDNIAGASPIILRVKPKEIIHSGIPSTSNYYNQYNNLFYPKNATTVPFDKKLIFEDAIISLIVPYDDGQPMTDDNSIVVKASYGNFNVLFTGDCGVDCESRISDIYTTVIVSNGACDSLSYTFLKVSSPEYIIFTGIPCIETLNRINGLAIPVLITSNDGDVIITSDGITYKVENSKMR